jgi:type I restriction enzyme M protein
MASSTEEHWKTNGATVGFESTLWQAADELRNNMDAAEYKHVMLGLIFLKRFRFVRRNALESKLMEGKNEYEGSNPEDSDEYRAEQFLGAQRSPMGAPSGEYKAANHW